MDLAGLRYRQPSRRTRADDLYDLAYGPPPPATRRPVHDEWDDPTWLAVEIDELHLAALIEQDERIARWRERRSREKQILTGTYGRRPRHLTHAVLDAVLDVLAAGPATAAQVQEAGALTSARTLQALCWLVGLGDVHSDQHPDIGQVFWRLATPEAEAVWVNRMSQTRAETDRRNREAAEAGGQGRAYHEQPVARRRPVSPPPPPPSPPSRRLLFPQDRAVLNVLAEAGDLTMGQLADRATRVGVSGMALPVILRGLVAKGLVSQVNDRGRPVARGQISEARYRLVTDSDLPGR